MGLDWVWISPGEMKYLHAANNRCLSSQGLPVVARYVEAPTFHEHPEGEENLGEVVHQQDVLQFVRLPILHEPATKDG